MENYKRIEIAQESPQKEFESPDLGTNGKLLNGSHMGMVEQVCLAVHDRV